MIAQRCYRTKVISNNLKVISNWQRANEKKNLKRKEKKKIFS